jgi:tRNA threonylcarbamoyladenosine biosynthesis protein TsaB
MGKKDEAVTNIANGADDGLLLALDTSTAVAAVAVLRGGALLAERSLSAERNHSVHLLTTVQELLRSLELRPRQLGGIAVGAGPGSYTGVRVAVSAAKTLAWTLGVPLAGVSTLAALALGAHRRASAAAPSAPAAAAQAPDAPAAAGRRWLVPLLNARRVQAFTAVYEVDGNTVGGLAERAADGVRLVRDWADELRGRALTAGGPVELVFCGETAGFEEILLEAFGGGDPAGEARALVLPHELQARDVGALGYARLLRGERDDVHAFVPNYTQLAEAEAKLLAKQQGG